MEWRRKGRDGIGARRKRMRYKERRESRRRQRKDTDGREGKEKCKIHGGSFDVGSSW